MGHAKELMEEYGQLDCPECGAQPWLSTYDGSREPWYPDASTENTDWGWLRQQLTEEEVSAEWEHAPHCFYAHNGEDGEILRQWLAG